MTGVCTHVAVWNIAVVCLCASVTFTYGDVRFGISQQEADWVQANRECDLPGTEELCDEGVCDAGKLKSLLDPTVQGQNITTWVRIFYNINQTASTRLTEGCYVYHKDYKDVISDEFGAIRVDNNSPESCANVCGFGIQRIFLLGDYCYCNLTRLFRGRPTARSAKKNTTENCGEVCKGSKSNRCGGIRNNVAPSPVYISEYNITKSDQSNPHLSGHSDYCVSVSTASNSFVLEDDCNRQLRCLIKTNRTETGGNVKASTKFLLTTPASTTEGSGPSTAPSDKKTMSRTGHSTTTKARPSISTGGQSIATSARVTTIMSTKSFTTHIKGTSSGGTNITTLTQASESEIEIYVGAGLAFLVVICIIVIIILLRKKKKHKSKLPEVQTVYTANANEEEQVNLLPVQNTDTRPDDSERPEYSYSDTTVTRTAVEGQYDQLDRTGQRPRQSVVSKDSTYDHADPTSQEVTYSETHRNRMSQTIDGDDVYDHADKNVHDDSEEVLNNDDTDYEQSIVNEVKDDTNKERSENGAIN